MHGIDEIELLKNISMSEWKAHVYYVVQRLIEPFYC